MHRDLLRWLICPVCAGCLELDGEAAEAESVHTGTLGCSVCGRDFPVHDGIPRMIPDGVGRTERATAEAFGWEWAHYQLLPPDAARRQFLHWVLPLQPEAFAGRVVLDAGCGMGRFTAVAADLGARLVIGVDLSDAVDVARQMYGERPNLQFVQADLLRLPFRGRPRHQAGEFDLVYSLGVLHHLEDPFKGFDCLSRVLRRNGKLFAWVYGLESNEWIVRWVNPIRQQITSPLPRRVLQGLSWAVGLTLFPLCVLAGRLPEHRRRGGIEYLAWLGGYGLRYVQHVVFDQLVAPVAWYLRQEEFRSWFDRAGLTNVSLVHRNQNSWGGVGQWCASSLVLQRCGETGAGL